MAIDAVPTVYVQSAWLTDPVSTSVDSNKRSLPSVRTDPRKYSVSTGLTSLAPIVACPIPLLVQVAGGAETSLPIHNRQNLHPVDVHSGSREQSHHPSPGKRGPDEDENSDDEEDGDKRDKRQGSGPLKFAKLDQDALLACPFYQRHKDIFRTMRACAGPGWRDIRRVKEHLYRKHAQPDFACPNCSEGFDIRDKYDSHIGVELGCQRPPAKPLPSLTKDQIRQLTSRKRAKEVVTAADKWREIFKISFPDVAEEDIPSPYYDIPSVVVTNSAGAIDYALLIDRLNALKKVVGDDFPEFIYMLFGEPPEAARNIEATSWILAKLEALTSGLGPDLDTPLRIPTPSDQTSSLPTDDIADYSTTFDKSPASEIASFGPYQQGSDYLLTSGFPLDANSVYNPYDFYSNLPNLDDQQPQ